MSKAVSLEQFTALPCKTIAVFGEGGTGKTAYIENLVNVDPRIGFTRVNESLYTCLHDGTQIRIVISDFKADADRKQVDIFRDARFACLFIDCTRMVTACSAEQWLPYIREQCGNDHIPIVYCMNKCKGIDLGAVVQFNHENQGRNMRMICVDHMHDYNADFIFYV